MEKSHLILTKNYVSQADYPLCSYFINTVDSRVENTSTHLLWAVRAVQIVLNRLASSYYIQRRKQICFMTAEQVTKTI